MNGAFHGIEKTRVIKTYNISFYGIDFSSDPTRPAGRVGSGRARARAENLNTDWNYLAGVCRPISGDNTHPAANQNTSIPPDCGINNKQEL